MLQLFIGEVIFAVLITKFKLRRFCFTKSFLERIKVISVFNKSRTLIIVTFVEGAIFAVFPEIKGVVAMRTPKFGFISEA
jgi:hypothetical protein